MQPANLRLPNAKKKPRDRLNDATVFARERRAAVRPIVFSVPRIRIAHSVEHVGIEKSRASFSRLKRAWLPPAQKSEPGLEGRVRPTWKSLIIRSVFGDDWRHRGRPGVEFPVQANANHIAIKARRGGDMVRIKERHCGG